MIKPLVSIILPTHNGERLIGRAIASVLAQTEKNFELIVILDGCTDATEQIVEQLAQKDARIKVIRQDQNQGIQRSLNAGLHAAVGEYIARIDDDDEWADNRKLEQQLAFFRQNPNYVLVGTGLIMQDEKGQELFRFLNPATDAEIRSKILYRNCFSHSTVMFKSAVARACGGYSESADALHAEDYDLWLKLGAKGKFANLPSYSVIFTQRPGAISSKHKLLQFKNQLAITEHSNILENVGMLYPNYRLSRLKSHLRYILYLLFGSLVPMSLQNRFIRLYKN